MCYVMHNYIHLDDINQFDDDILMLCSLHCRKQYLRLIQHVLRWFLYGINMWKSSSDHPYFGIADGLAIVSLSKVLLQFEM